MVTRKAFRSGGCVVVALPKHIRTALKILPGTPLTLIVRDRALVISRAVTTPESMVGTDHAGQVLRETREDNP